MPNAQIRINKTKEMNDVLHALRSIYRLLNESELVKLALSKMYESEIERRRDAWIASTKRLSLTILPETFGIMKTNHPITKRAMQGIFWSITKTIDEVSVVCEEKFISKSTSAERGWKALKVQGPLDFNLTGILASIASPLATVGVSIFAISTFDTDYVLVKETKLSVAIASLERAGHTVVR